MIGVSVANLIIVDLVLRVTFNKIVAYPLDVAERIIELSALLICGFVLVYAPREHCCGIRHGQVELYVVARIVQSSREVETGIRAVRHSAVAAPVCTRRRLVDIAAPLQLVKQQRFLERLAVIERACALNALVSAARRGKTVSRRTEIVNRRRNRADVVRAAVIA